MNEKTMKGCGWSLVAAVIFIVAAVLMILSGCKSVEVVPVTERHTEHHWHTDSVFQRDSVIRETNTTIMQLDSAAMARYGIRLSEQERAWMVRTKELEHIISAMERETATRDTVRDSIPVVVKVPVEVKRQLSLLERLRMAGGDVLAVALLFAGLWLFVRKGGIG